MKLTEILTSVKPRPRAYILMGAPSSGKTHWAESYMKKNRLFRCHNLNIGDFLGKEERNGMLEECIEKGHNFIFEGLALKEDRFQGILDKLKASNYKTFLVYVNRDLETITENDKGRNSLKTIRKLIEKNELLFNEFKDKFDEAIEVN